MSDAAQCFLDDRPEPGLIGPKEHRWFSRLAIEHDSLRAALGWPIAQHDAEAAVRLGGALYRFWADHGHHEEGRRWLEHALALEPNAVSTPRGNAFIGLRVMAYFQGNYDRAAALWDESLALLRALGYTTGIDYSYDNLGFIADAKEDCPRAIPSYEQALALFRELHDRTYIGYMLHNLGLIACFQKDYERARTLYEESLSLARDLGDENSVALILGNLGLVALAEGDSERALAHQQQALVDWRLVNNKPWLARGVEHFALIAAATGDGKRAARLFGAALREAFGTSQQPNDRELVDRYSPRARERLGEPVFPKAWDEGARMSLEEALMDAPGEDCRASPSRTGRRNDDKVARATTRWEERG